MNKFKIEVLISSKSDEKGDQLEITQITNKKYIATNLRTGKTSLIPEGLISNPLFCKKIS